MNIYNILLNNDIKLKRIGFGLMRLKRNGKDIDLVEAEKEILHAVKRGVNYFDTAYIYPGSEKVFGDVLSRNPGLRDNVFITTKLPHYLVKNVDDAKRIFEEELDRLKTNYVDCYFLHMINDVRSFERLKSIGVIDYLESEKKNCRIKSIGFSYHGNADEFIKLIDAYPFERCQIQYNYIDENSQGGVAGLKYAYSKGIPVVIMEPLRGGKLVNNLPKDAKKIIDDKYGFSPARFGLQWLFNQKEIAVVLSGMNSVEMIDDNIDAEENTKVGMLTEDDFKVYEDVKKIILEKTKVPCTGCRYCMPCKQGVDIPGIFSAYNKVYTDSYKTGLKEYFMCTSARHIMTRANKCISCKVCESHCPQHIHISDELKKAKKVLEFPGYGIICAIIHKIIRY